VIGRLAGPLSGIIPGALRGAVAAGLCLFGAYSLIEARYRVLPDPHLKQRVAGAFS
jgi:hypothetical protein